MQRRQALRYPIGAHLRVQLVKGGRQTSQVLRAATWSHVDVTGGRYRGIVDLGGETADDDLFDPVPVEDLDDPKRVKADHGQPRAAVLRRARSSRARARTTRSVW